MATDVYQAWNHRWLGTATIDWTDDSGTRSVSITSADAGTNGEPGLFAHLALTAVDPKDRGGTTVNLGFADFASKLQAVMDAATAQTVTASYSASTLKYTLTCTGTTFTVGFVGAAGDRMRRILGFTGGLSGATQYDSNMTPWYVRRAAVDAKTAFRQPAAIGGLVRSRRADDGTIYSIGPTRVPREAAWEHRMEAKKAVHRRFADADTLASGASWTYEDAIDHAARYGVPCVVRDGVESMVFYLDAPFTREAFERSRQDMDPLQLVRLRAASVIGYL